MSQPSMSQAPDKAVADPSALASSRRAEQMLVPATFITTAGNTFQLTAATVLVYRADHTTVSVGGLFIAVAIPQVVLSVFFGRLADRVDRRRLSMTADLISAVSAFALPVWLWLHGPTAAGAYLANFLLAVTAALFMPASNALVKERVLDERLGRFNSHFERANNLGMLSSAAAAGFLVSLFGTTPLFVFNSLTFVASAAFTFLIGPKPAAPALDAQEGGGAAAGAAAVEETGKPVKRLAIQFANLSMGLLVANTVLATLILHSFHKGPWLIGVTDALAGAGFLTGAALYDRISKRFTLMQLAFYGTMLNLAMFCLQPLNYIVLMVAISFAGFGFALSRIAARTLLMQASPHDRVGRIFGGVNAVGLGAGITANIALSALADHTAVPDSMWTLAAIQVSVAVGAYVSLIRPMAAQHRAAAEALEATPA